MDDASGNVGRRSARARRRDEMRRRLLEVVQLVRLVDGLADIVWNTLYAPAPRSQSGSVAA